jgi:hypothetical protein
MKINLIFSIATVAFLCSCAEEDGTVSYLSREDGHIVRIVAGFDPSTRTVLNNNNTVSWTSGDKICVNGVESAAAAAASSGPLPAATAMFTVSSLTDPTGPYYCLYPSSLYTNYTGGSTYAGGVYPVELPSAQPYLSTGFAQDINPSAAYKTSGNASFKNLCGIVKVTVTKTGRADITKVRFLAKNEYVSGEGTVTITSSGATLTMGTGATSNKYVDVEFSAAQAVSGTDIYFVVPAQTYSAGLAIALINSNGDIVAGEVTQSSLNIARGSITYLGSLQFPFTIGGSNIYWDTVNNRPTFYTQKQVEALPDNNNPKYYQGLHFMWGSLIGLDTTIATWDDSTFQVYFPSDMTANATWSHDAVANTVWSTYLGIPEAIDWTFASYTLFGRTSYNLPLSFNNYQGDICRFLTLTDDAPAGFWRTPTQDEWGDLEDYTSNYVAGYTGYYPGSFDPLYSFHGLGNAFGTFPIPSGVTYSILGTYFPASGSRSNDGELYDSNASASYYSASFAHDTYFDYKGIYYMFMNFSGVDVSYFVTEISHANNAGMPVRCVKN